MIDSTWPRPGISRNDYLLARARTGRRKSKPDGRWALVLGAALDESASLPFGGYKQSGWGREMGEEVLHNYTEIKAVTTAL